MKKIMWSFVVFMFMMMCFGFIWTEIRMCEMIFKVFDFMSEYSYTVGLILIVAYVVIQVIRAMKK